MRDVLTVPLPSGGVRFTDRAEGNMSLVAGAGHEHGREHQQRLRRELGLDGLARGYQVHGTRVVTAARATDPHAPQEQLERADGQATATRSLGVMVLAADCLPVALGAPGGVAMLHAGWRGLAGGVLEEGVSALASLGAGPVTAVLGPCAGPCCYEVGPEVHAALASGIAGRGRVDLRLIACTRLHEAGVQTVRSVGGCTICDERFFSHRREGAEGGRQVGVAWLS
jgi:purine-nucleoside/S-methyl-5'-thioadenosine phosphorylase / adenosine deaminase